MAGGEVEIRGPVTGRFGEVLTPDALAFVAGLQREFGPRRAARLQARAVRQAELDAGGSLDFLAATRPVREAAWTVAPAPRDCQRRWVEITGPAERKMIINALNCGADVFMADFEDANTPTWTNMVQGQVNLIDAIERTIEYRSPDGRRYRLNEQVATLLVRPRGWHLPEKHAWVDGQPVSGSLFDAGLYLFHNGRRLLDRGSGPYFYLPKLESHLEARLWNDVFVYAQARLGLPRGSVRATVLIETIPAAFEMDEILYELREHAGGLNAGRWDYMFSLIKKFRARPDFVLPDRSQVTMTVPFMRAYTELLVKTCHRRGAHALGGMAAFIPSRRDPEVNEVALARVREDKLRESRDGFDGTWVAHPDLVTVAREPFRHLLGDRPHQVDRQRPEVTADARALIAVRVPGGSVTEAGLRNNVSVAIQYLAAWLGGTGAVAIYNLMEDAATAEISRSQVWQWIRHGVRLAEGPVVTRELVRAIEREELDRLRGAVGGAAFAAGHYMAAAEVFETVALGDEFVEFLTLPAYEQIGV
ncbi:MAG TPA: malate synthase A [Methylomirabilota bacterium]|nr:malate synthase A [Methylomirabilota bacterium]